MNPLITQDLFIYSNRAVATFTLIQTLSMINKTSLFILSIVVFYSCQGQPKKTANDSVQNISSNQIQEPDYNYSIQVPESWTINDTVVQGLRVRFIKSPMSLSVDNPHGNILIAYMQGENIDEFTTNNMNNLKAEMQGIVLLERGNITTTTRNGTWFTYTKQYNGITTDMINYIIPVNGFAYMITFGTNKGTISKYRNLFDKIVQSLHE